MNRAVSGRPRMSARLARALALDGNPLRRASDRAEAWIRVGLLAAFLIAGPIAAHAAGGWVHRAGTAELSADAMQVHPVQAVLLQPAVSASALNAPYEGNQVWVRARWQSPGAPARTGTVLAPRGSRPGTVVTVWLTASGQVTAAPPDAGQAANDETALAVLATLVMVALALLAVLRIVRRFLTWRRLAAWEAAWSAIGPLWSGRTS